MAGLPDNLDRVRKEATETLRARLTALCDEADDKFFDLSQNAPAEEQSLYFDAMKELRVQRPAIVDGVCAAVGQAFQALLAPAPEKPRSGLSGSLDSLSLLDDDELDVSVAFQGMVSRAREVAANDIDHLRQRVSKVLAREIDGERLPLHPAQVCDFFRTVIDKTSIRIKARLILYKFFERTVLETLRDIIAQANQTLIAAGVLPEIKSAKPRPLPSADRSRGGKKGGADSEEASGSGSSSGSGGGSSDGAGAALSELLSLARQALGVRGGGGGGMPGFGGMPGGFAGGGVAGGGAPQVISLQELPAGQLPVMHDGQLMAGGMIVRSDVPVQVVAPVELTQLLTRLQQLQMPALPAGQVIEHAELVDVKGGLSELITDGEKEEPKAINSADDDLINVVSMLFDFILDDRDLPPEMKALIGRLQIPMLKVALLDRDFFGEQEHPARQLVNALAKAGVGWTRDSDDGLYQRMTDIVYAVLNEFTDDLALFERLGSDFSTFVAEREKRMSLIENRLRDREEGQAKAEDAQKKVREVVARMLGGRRLPDEALAYVQECWQQVLYMTALRETVDSDAWQQRVKALEVLVWCAQAQDKADAVQKQRALVPRLVVSLRKGMEAAGVDIAGADARLDALQAALQRLIDGAKQHTVKVVAEAPPAGAPAMDKPASRAAEAVQVLRRTEGEVVIVAPPVAAPAEDKPAVDQRWLQMADSLAPGTWIEFAEEDFKVRAKIAARIRIHNKFVFVNGRGVKTAEKTVEQLAMDFEAGVARLVNDTALFDRALEGMIARLKTGQPG